MDGARQYRRIAVGESVEDAVTVGIEPVGSSVAASVWWPSKGDVDAEEAEFGTVAEALDAAEAAQTLHGFAEIVIAIDDPARWNGAWGVLGNTGGLDLSDEESYELAAALEAERDA